MRRLDRLLTSTQHLGSRVLRVAAWGLLAVFSVLLLAWLILQWGILPQLDRWRPEVEQAGSRWLGLELRIGKIEAPAGSWMPTVELSDVVLHDAQHRPALKLPRVLVALSPRSLLLWRPRFSQLLVEGAQVELRRDSQGRLLLGGFDLDQPASLDSSALNDWLFEQPELAVRQARLRWVDELRKAEPLELSAVDAELRNGLLSHDLKLAATPPAGWGQRFEASGHFTQGLLQAPGDWTRWKGHLQADLPQVDVGRLNRHADLPFELREGRGALKLRLDIDRLQWRGLQAQVALEAVNLRLGPHLEALRLDHLSTRLEARREAEGIRLTADELAFQTHDGLNWPAGRISLAWHQRQDLDAAPSAWLAATTPPLAARSAAASGPASTPASTPARAASAPVATGAGKKSAAKAPLASPQPAGPSGGEFSADRLDLALLTRIATRVPLPETWRQRLRDVMPRGLIRPVRLQWQGSIEQPRQWRLSTGVEALGLNGLPSASPEVPGIPGIRGLSATLEATEAGGQASFKVESGALDLPGVFEEPLLPLNRLQGQARWTISPPAAPGEPKPLEVVLSSVQFANADTQGELNVHWRTGQGRQRWPGLLELDGHLGKVAAARVPRYLPQGLHAPVRQYLASALVGGYAQQVNFKVQGDLAQFPFAQGDGQFRIALQAQDVTLAYVPPDAQGKATWPALTQVHGELVFDRDAMEIRNASARQWGVVLSQVNGGISHLGSGARLVLEGHGKGPAADMLRFVQESPINGWLGHALSQASLSGMADLKLGLNLPLGDLRHSQVKGTVNLLGSDVRIRSDVPMLANARAKLEFSETGFSIAGAKAEVAGGEAIVEAATVPEGGVRVNVQGDAEAQALRELPELGQFRRLGQVLEGRSTYRVMFQHLNAGGSELRIQSSLQGMAVDLPRPLRKKADTLLPLSIILADLKAEASHAPRDLLRVELGPVLAEYLRDTSGAQPQVLRGLLQVGEGRAIPDPEGVVAAARLNSLDLDAWMAALERLQSPAPVAVPPTASQPPLASQDASLTPAVLAGLGVPLPGGAVGSPASGNVGGAGGTTANPPPAAAEVANWSAYLPRQISLGVQRLSLGGRSFTNIDARIQRLAALDSTRWVMNVNSPAISGRVDYQASSRPDEPAQWTARLSRLAVPARDALPDELPTAQPTKTLDPKAQVPALDVVVEDLELRGRKLGRFEAVANYRGQGAGREWLLSRLRLSVPEAVLSAQGSWQPLGRRRMALDFEADIRDSGPLGERLGLGRTLRGGAGRITGKIGWPGSPLSPDLQDAEGELHLALETGQFLRAEPGAARFLGVLSLQSLARRLTLDFRDVFQEGFTFDNVSGDIRLADGIARTNNLRVRGVQALVLLDGSSDLRDETQNLRVLVVPQINAGTASLAYATINPAVGLGTFLAQVVLRDSLAEAGTREFHITGSWSDPQIETLPSPSPAGASAAKSAAGAASPASAPSGASATAGATGR